MKNNFDRYAPFSAIERILMNACKNGADRQDMHEHLRVLSMEAWAQVSQGLPNPLLDVLEQDKMILTYLSREPLQDCLPVKT